LDDVVSPVLRAWNVFERNDLSGDGLVARDELTAFMSKSAKEAEIFNDKREVHFERLVARGQSPIRIQK
jgi:acyl-[acyl-carrier-protein] desaturase